MDRGSVEDGTLTCHWHHARFDLASGCTFDLWADDVPTCPAELRDGEVWVRPAFGYADPAAHWCQRLDDGHVLGLVIANAVCGRLAAGVPPPDFVRQVALFGIQNRDGWGVGLTILAALGNLLPVLPEEESVALLEAFDRQRQVDLAARLVARHSTLGHSVQALIVTLARALLREDAGFHAYQALDAAVRQFGEWGNTDEGRHILIAVARYLAAHSPTERAELQTAEIARRLMRGGELHREATAWHRQPRCRRRTLREAQIVIESWRRHFNTIRPHASFGYKPPAPEVFVPAFAAWPAALRQPASPAMLAPRLVLN